MPSCKGPTAINSIDSIVCSEIPVHFVTHSLFSLCLLLKSRLKFFINLSLLKLMLLTVVDTVHKQLDLVKLLKSVSGLSDDENETGTFHVYCESVFVVS